MIETVEKTMRVDLSWKFMEEIHLLGDESLKICWKSPGIAKKICKNCQKSLFSVEKILMPDAILKKKTWEIEYFLCVHYSRLASSAYIGCL